MSDMSLETLLASALSTGGSGGGGGSYDDTELRRRVTTLEGEVNGIDTQKLEELADIKRVGSGLNLDANGELTATGGSGSTDWNNITNKPTDLVEDANYVHTDNNFTTADKDKLAGLSNYDDTALQGEVDALDASLVALIQTVAKKGEAFVAEYNVTTAQQIIEFINGNHEPCAPMVVKSGTDYYTVITATKMADNRAIIRTFTTLSGTFYIFTYDITDSTWANNNYGVQKVLVSGTDIKTVNGQSLLGSGNLEVGGGGSTSWNEITGKPTDLAEAVELTQAEYDLLTETEKKNGKIYFITDGQGGGGGEVPTLDEVLKKGGETTETASFVNAAKTNTTTLKESMLEHDQESDTHTYHAHYGAGSVRVQTVLKNNGDNMYTDISSTSIQCWNRKQNGNYTQIRVNPYNISLNRKVGDSATPVFEVEQTESGNDVVRMNSSMKQSFKNALELTDSSWETNQGGYVTINARLKNGWAFIDLSGGYLRKDIPAGGKTITTLGNKYKPTTSITVPLMVLPERTMSGTVSVDMSGNVIVNTLTAIEVGGGTRSLCASLVYPVG